MCGVSGKRKEREKRGMRAVYEIIGRHGKALVAPFHGSRLVALGDSSHYPVYPALPRFFSTQPPPNVNETPPPTFTLHQPDDAKEERRKDNFSTSRVS